MERRFGIKASLDALDVGADPATEQAEEKKQSDEDGLHQPVPSVGIASMDAEHGKCEKALSLLLATPNTQTLENALVELTDHFTHEEHLMKEHGFGRADSSDPFSPFASHVKDHERILNMGYHELARASTKAQAMVCSKEEGESSS